MKKGNEGGWGGREKETVLILEVIGPGGNSWAGGRKIRSVGCTPEP